MTQGVGLSQFSCRLGNRPIERGINATSVMEIWNRVKEGTEGFQVYGDLEDGFLLDFKMGERKVTLGLMTVDQAQSLLKLFGDPEIGFRLGLEYSRNDRNSRLAFSFIPNIVVFEAPRAILHSWGG